MDNDANASDSSALETAFKSQEPVSETPVIAEATPSAATLKPETAKAQEIPFHENPRFQQILRERDEARLSAGEAKVWQEALKENPQFAKRILQVIEELSQDDKPKLNDLDPVAERLLSTGPFKSLLEKLSGFENTLTEGSRELSTQRFNATSSKYVADFKSYMDGVEVLPELQKVFERRVWDELSESSPDAVKAHKYDQSAFKMAVDNQKEWYSKVANGLNSKFTQKASLEQTPKTQRGGLTMLSTTTSEEEELKNFASQLASLS